MATATLSATPRSTTGTGAARKLRAAAQVPAVIYGHHREAQAITLDARSIERLLERVSAETTVVELSIDGTTARTLIRDVQRHPVRRSILHVDFQQLVAGEMVVVNVPIVLVGTPAGTRNAGGVLDQVVREVEVEVDPANIPNHIDVDVSALDLNDSLHIRDLTLPEGVTVLDDPDNTICVCVPPRVEVAETPAAEAAAPEGGEPELIRKPKPDEGEGEG